MDQIAIPLISGVRALHAIGVSHGDIKPDNVVVRLSPDRRIIVGLEYIDFDQGVLHSALPARLDTDEERLVMHRVLMEGSPRYVDVEAMVFAKHYLPLATAADAHGMIKERDHWSLAMLLLVVYLRRFPDCAEPGMPPSTIGPDLISGLSADDAGAAIDRAVANISSRLPGRIPELERMAMGVLGQRVCRATGSRVHYFE
jgi:serine/threonine protein kinase